MSGSSERAASDGARRRPVAILGVIVGAAALAPVAALLVLAGCGESEGQPEGSSSERLALRPAGSVEGAPLGYAEYLPPGYGDGNPRPLLVFLHGGGENGDGSERALDKVFKLGVPALIESDGWPEDRPFAVLMPQYGPDEAEACLHAEELDSFLKFALNHYDVDKRRVYLTGVSCGAIGVWDYIAVHGDELIAAAVPIAGHLVDAFAEAGCKLGRVPVWAFHGEDDEIVPVDLGVADPIADLKACADPRPTEVRLTTYPGADHDAWSQTYDLSAGHDIYAWLLSHDRP